MSTDHRRAPTGPDRREAPPLAVRRIRHGPPDAPPSAFATQTPDPDAQLAGRFHATTIVRNRPRTLGTWHVTTTSWPTADRVARLLGGHARQDPTTGRVEVLTAASTVGILLEGPEALRVGWRGSANGACDGATQGDGQPCACPAGLAARRSAAKRGRGCRPRVEVRFALTDDPAAGAFGFASDDWSFAEQAVKLRTLLCSSDQAVLVRLALHRTLHALPSGRALAYTRPVLTLVERTGPAAPKP